MESLNFVYDSFGEPAEVLFVKKITISEALSADEVLIKFLAAPVHPSDIGMITGRYGNLPALPALGGREGLGEIISAGDGCKNFIGRRVKMPFGSWRTLAKAKARELFFVPDGIDLYQVAMAFINPVTAWMLLKTIRTLNAGDWIIQNAANSAVGISVIQIARSIGVKTINLVRDADSRREYLSSIGATLVFDESEFSPKLLEDHVGSTRPILGLNSIGGESAMNIIKCMFAGGEVVTFGGMVSEKVRFPTRELIFNDLRLRGFWLDKFIKTAPRDEVQKIYDISFDLIKRGIVNIPIDSTVKFSAGPKALIEAYNNKKNGKVLLVA